MFNYFFKKGKKRNDQSSGIDVTKLVIMSELLYEVTISLQTINVLSSTKCLEFGKTTMKNNVADS